ncbi:hypothetical protein L1049_001249 [Liquidambar formosana]|uniref:Receptor-like serine/threonine-protein kinase n=1 Tax=Liquidambar formosana TaxID=63359 RepID=A0AAP0R626_LIQFO
MKTSMEGYTILFFCSLLLSIFLTSTATDTITMSQPIRDGETIVSAGGSFELGIFSPDSMKRYLGIWYKKISIPTVVWVANRESTPLVDSSGVLKVTKEGILQLLNRNGSIIWSSNSSRWAQNPVAKLLDTGNLVVIDEKDDNPENFLWQSFDYPCDTLLPGMKLGRNMTTGLEWHLSSWKSTDNPSPGDFTYRLDPQGFPQFVVRDGSVEQFRSGPWNGLHFSGFPDQIPYTTYNPHFVFNQKETYYTDELCNDSVVTRLVLNRNGIIQRFSWNDQTQDWDLSQSVPKDNCDNYAICGAYGSCNIGNSQDYCGCLKGFVPKSQQDWDISDYSNGCVRRMPLNCGSGDGFTKHSGIKFPDTRYSWYNESMTLKECESLCLKNCSCMAYTSLDVRNGGSGCLLWFGDLIDIRAFPEDKKEIYIRMASSEIGMSLSLKLDQVGSKKKKRVWIIVSLALLVGMVFLGLGLTLFVRKKKKLSREGKKGHTVERGYTTEELELPLFDLATVANATNNFSINNKLGQGGFGLVYKGVLEDGQEIAVKRLSKNSRQGLNEFKNEVIHIAKLQHRNLVKLLGCCLQVDETILIYEFMPNKSLDFFIFDHTRSILLDWTKRFQIIIGIAQGLLYLHRDSRLRIIHRDLKAGNILLDNKMNPKISDFGLARSFDENETEGNTKKVVGTYGYMSPEYAIDGLYSVKSDVFSFGVLLLEIAWRLYIEGKPLELIDASIGDSSNTSEVLRAIHVGLLCVQRCPEDRPNMSTVVLMLGSESELPQPKQPGFFNERNLVGTDSSSHKHEPCSTNEVTITLLEAR